MELTTVACMLIAPILLVAMSVPANRDMWTMEMELFVVRCKMLCTTKKIFTLITNIYMYKISSYQNSKRYVNSAYLRLTHNMLCTCMLLCIQCVRTGIFDLRMELMSLKDELRCVLTMNMVQSVMISGMTWKLEWYVDNWDMREQVNSNEHVHVEYIYKYMIFHILSTTQM